MKYLSLFLLLLSTMSYGARFKSGVANECKRPKVSVDYSTLPKTSKDYEHCLHLFKETGKKMCCIDSGVANSNNECKPPKSLIDMTLVRFTKAGNTLCQRNVIPNTNTCCIDLSTVVEANDCPKGSTLTALSSFNPKSQRVQYNICLNSLIKGTKNCCMFPIR